MENNGFLRICFSKRFRPHCYLVGVSIAFLLWMALEAYQSHYISGLRLLGDTTTESIVGVAKSGRGDEWSTYLPMLKQAYLEGFPARSSLRPYAEKFDWFISIPHADLSLVFLPNHLTYWVLPGGKALAFQGFYYNLLLLGSIVWFLINIGVKARLALVAAIALTFSHFYQVWWTSNYPALAASILPFAVITSRLRTLYKYPLLFWSVGHMMFGQIYPPFYISLAVALVPFTIAVRPDLIRLKQVVLTLAATAAAIGIYAILKLEFISAISATTYPGHRISTGGGSSLSTYASILFPTFPSSASFNVVLSQYELSVAGTFFPLLLLAILPSIKWDRVAIRVSLVSAFVAIVLIIYSISGFPEWLSRLTGFYLVPGRRMHIGISDLALFYSVFMISRNWERIKPIPIVVVVVGYAVLSLVVGTRSDIVSEFYAVDFYPYIPLFIIILGGFSALLFSQMERLAQIIVSFLVFGMALVHVVIFGSFNPLMRAGDILTPVDSQLTRDWKALYHLNNERPFAVIGNYGHLLRGEGLEALQAVHLVNVDRQVYVELFPYLSDAELDSLFNRFTGIAFDNINEVDTSRGATSFFPVKSHTVSFAHEVNEDSSIGDALRTGKITTAVNHIEGSLYVVRWQSVLDKPLAIDELLMLTFICDVENSWVTRYPMNLGRGEITGVALQGIAGEVTVNAKTEKDALDCISGLKIATRAK